MKFFTSTVLALATATTFAVADMDAKERKLDGHLENPALDYIYEVICFEPESLSLDLGDDDDSGKGTKGGGGGSKRKLYQDEEDNMERKLKAKGGGDDDDDDDSGSGRPGRPTPPFAMYGPPNTVGYWGGFVVIDPSRTEDVDAGIEGRKLGSADEDILASEIFDVCDFVGGHGGRKLDGHIDPIGELYVNGVYDYRVGPSGARDAEVLSANATGRSLFFDTTEPIAITGSLAIFPGVSGISPDIVSFAGYNLEEIQQYAADVRTACRQQLLLPELDLLEGGGGGRGTPRRNAFFDGFPFPYWFTGGTPTGFQHGFILKIAEDFSMGYDLYYIYLTNDYSDLSGVDPEVYAYLAALQSGAYSCFPDIGKKGGGMGTKGGKKGGY